MVSSLWNLVNNFSEGIHKTKWKFGHDDKNMKNLELNISITSVFLNIQNIKMIQQHPNIYVVTKVINTSLTKS